MFEKHFLHKLVYFMILLVLAVFFLFPLGVTLTNSLMSEQEIAANYGLVTDKSLNSYQDSGADPFARFELIPDMVTLKQYYSVLLKKTQFLFMFWNSVLLTFPIVIGQTLVATLAAYAFAKMKFKGRDVLFFLYIVVMLMPFQVTLVPNYIIAGQLGLLNNPLSIIFPGIFSTFGVFLLKQYMEQIPDSYLEAAKVDGANPFQIFLKIIVPMSRAGIAAMAILVFIDNWNMVEQPLIFLQDATRQPLSLYLAKIVDGEKGLAFAASTLYMLPMLLNFLYAERYLLEGIRLSGIKG
ncbi:binding-protein-dependent transport systems inner membrane component [Desulfitobacterium hafniense DCB-2]|uniref:Binding-protein-dependent transport systems inner membrane component n=1 Tax=Desulfitobacterium hafniense (strain DSM 10664 / DCB-2) TaxID=272564 RepID=B8FS57_DESHD|nr:carbohydrate ABC transporter permease [Desulfitobacterium hafniense]ACL20195.1 binding-protein-dependent transport systems inner membrane component [Desulfitobacterium hafniense DCB-2]